MTELEKARLIELELEEARLLLAFSYEPLPSDVEKAVRYIHAHLFEEALGVQEVKAGCGLRSNNLSSRFKLSVGMGIRAYIENCRLQAAMRLLWHEDLEVYLVGHAVGYAYPESFTRAFTRSVGCTPSEFRTYIVAAHRGEPAPIPSGPE